MSMQSFIESTWATFGRKDDNKTNITNRLRSNISWRGNSMNGKLKNRLLYVNEVKKTLDYAENAIKNEGGEPYFPNAVRTCKYSVINFLPKSLFEQFRRVANLYFLMISLLQLCTDLSPTNPYSTIGPLTLVLFVTMFKEALEDRNRHKQDYIVNHQKAEVYGPISEMSSHSNKKVGHSNQNKYISTFWKNIQVGHIVKVKEKEQVPADMVILFTSEERGEAMCETSTLDGESNLKVRTALHWNQIEPLQVEDFGTTVAAEISCELPNRHLYSFDGVIKLAYTTDAAKSEAAARQEANSCSPHLSPRGPIPDSDEIPITIDNVMLRGMKLLNTKWAIGVVVGAGPDSKLIQNMKEIPSKFSHLDRIANRCIALIFSVLFAVCCFSSLKHVSYYVKIITDDQAEKKNHLTELPFRNATLDSFNLTDFLNSWITYLILYNNMVPISLYISLEIVKWYQARKIENDPLMNCKVTGHGVTARTSNVNEDLGQIKYIFSDKTGTLTKNQMIFKVCSIGGIIYDGMNMQVRRKSNISESSVEGSVGPSGNTSASGTQSRTTRRMSRYAQLSEKDVRPHHHLLKIMEHPDKSTEHELHSMELAKPFFRCLLICHSASISTDDAPKSTNGVPSLLDDPRWTGISPVTGRRKSSITTPVVERDDESETASEAPVHIANTPVSCLQSHAKKLSSPSGFYAPLPPKKYFGSSPDEVALLNAALEFNCAFEEREGDIIHITLFGQKESYRVLAHNEFDSIRKCMSVVVEKLPIDSGIDDDLTEKKPVENDKREILTFCKGADTVMLANSIKTQDASKLALHVHYFAAMALRTLLFGVKNMTYSEYESWKHEYDSSKKALVDRERMCTEVAKKLETSITLLGATGVEDLLQDGVKECIEQLGIGGINVWMLTGDKDETAISVGNMCGLINVKSRMFIVKGKSKQDCLNEIAYARRKLKREGAWAPGVASRNTSLVINGEALEHLLSDTPSKMSIGDLSMTGSQVTPGDPRADALPRSDGPVANMTKSSTTGLAEEMGRRRPGSTEGSKDASHAQYTGSHRSMGSISAQSRATLSETFSSALSSTDIFMELATQCSSVIACRLSPMQKAQVVALMKSTAGLPLTLAIGDGGNDVSMIQEAHVGIGIYGHEGMQAVRAADFAIATFHHLSRLLLVHGRWNHRRVSNVILFSFYKNMALIVTLLMYSLENGYSGQTLYESYLMVGWNVLYTILPIFVLGISDEDICDNAVLHYPFVYRSALRKSELSIQKLSIWVANAWLHSAIVYFVTTRTLKYIVSPQGFANGLFVDGTAVYGALIITVSLKAALIMQRFHRWTKLHYISLVGGFAIFLVFVLVYSQAYSLMPQFNFLRDFYGIATMLFEEKMYWVMLAFISITSIIPDLAAAYFKEMYIPASDDIIREIDSGLGTSSSSSDKTQETVNAFRRASRLTERNDSSNRIVSIAAVAAAAVAGVNIKQRQDVSSSLIDGEWSQKFRDFDRPTEHDELSKQLVALQTEIAHELGTADPVSREEEAHSSRALAVNPAVHPLTLEFMGEEHRQLENEYAFTSACRERARFLLCLKVVAILIPVYALIEYYIEKDNNKWTIRIGFLVSDLILLRFVKTKIFLKNYTSSILATFCLAGIALTITIAQNGKFGAALYPIGLFVVVRVKFLYALSLSLANFFFYVFYLLLTGISGKINFGSDGRLSSEGTQMLVDHLLFTIYMVFVILFGGYACYSLQLTMRRDFLQSRSLLLEQKRSTQILKNMLPEHVVKRMQKGETAISEDENDVTILFCDIADFSSFVKRFSPTEVVSMLDKIYSLFDQICQKHGVRKMETVGKTYMACAGLQGKDRGKEAALRAAAMALDMLSTMEKCKTSNGSGIKIRIGIHSGRVISGLVGMKKQQFSLFGDTVNTASRMQSTGITGGCQVSQVTYKKLAGHFIFEERQIDVKGKGSMTTYMLGQAVSNIAHLAVQGKLEQVVKRESMVNIGGDGIRKPLFDAEFLHRNRLLQKVKLRWSQWNLLRILFGPDNLNESYMTSVEEEMLPEIQKNLTFKDEEMEVKYLDTTLHDRIEGARRSMYFLAAYLLFSILRDFTLEQIGSRIVCDGESGELNVNEKQIINLILYPIRILGACIFIFMGSRARKTFDGYSENNLRNLLMTCYIFGLCCVVLTEALLWHQRYSIYDFFAWYYVYLCLDAVLVMFAVSNGGSLLFKAVLVFNSIALIIVTVPSAILLFMYGTDDMKCASGNKKFQKYYPLVCTYLSVIVNVYASYSAEFFTRRKVWLKTRTQIETQNADRLLYQMLPAAVVMRLKEAETVCDQHQQVGILFSDIKGFTTIASQAKTDQVVNILSNLFCAFDKLTEKHGVFKMQTIGDAYVIVSGLPYVDMSLSPALDVTITPTRSGSTCAIPVGDFGVSKNELVNQSKLTRRGTLKEKFQMHIRSHIRDLLMMARDMHQEVCKLQDPNTGERLQMRIGIHIGTIIGGVIGTSTLRYDMWGPDALTANELESNGVPERTLVSPAVVEAVKGMDDIRCTFHKKVNFTNLNLMDTYLVEFVDPNSPAPPATSTTPITPKQNEST